jgi:two-component system CheB/CheR fusion protein
VGAFLEVAPGQASLSVLAMAREGLRSALASALHAAARRDGEVVHRDVDLEIEGERFPVRLAVRKIADRGALRGMLAITFESAPLPARRPRPPRGAGAKSSRGRVAQLEAELLHTREDLWRTIGELQSANEDLTSFTEEVQSVNEELQSTNEELETSREEMQSLNEELQTVNAELQSKIEALSEVNDDLRNLLDGTQIATVFVDRALRVKRFTKEARKVIPLIESDIGRPISDMMTSLEYPDLMRDVEEVLQKAVLKELRVRAKDGAWYALRISPYRTSSERVEGVVLTLVDITGARQAEQKLREALDLAESIVDTVRDPLVILDTELRVVSASLAFHHLFQTRPEEVARQPLERIAGRRLDAPQLRRLLEQVVAGGEAFNDFELECALPGAGKARLRLNARRVEREGRRTGLILLGAERSESCSGQGG